MSEIAFHTVPDIVRNVCRFHHVNGLSIDISLYQTNWADNWQRAAMLLIHDACHIVADVAPTPEGERVMSKFEQDLDAVRRGEATNGSFIDFHICGKNMSEWAKYDLIDHVADFLKSINFRGGQF